MKDSLAIIGFSHPKAFLQIEREYPVFFLSLARADLAPAGAAAELMMGDVCNQEVEVVDRQEVKVRGVMGWCR